MAAFGALGALLADLQTTALPRIYKSRFADSEVMQEVAHTLTKAAESIPPQNPAENVLVLIDAAYFECHSACSMPLIDQLVNRNRFKCVTVLATSTDRATFKWFNKYSDVVTTYSSPLTEEHAGDLFKKLMPDDDRFSERWESGGCILRHLLQDQSSVMTSLLLEAQEIGIANLATPTCVAQRLPHVFAFWPPKEQNSGTIDFASNAARKAVEDRLATLSGGEDGRLIDQLVKQGTTADVIGRVFERYFLKQMEKGVRLLLVPLGEYMPRSIDTNNISTSQFSSLKGLQMVPKTLYIPMASNFPVVDAVLREDGIVMLIHVTVSTTRSPTKESFDELVNTIEQSNPKIPVVMVWVGLCGTGGVRSRQSNLGDVPQYRCTFGTGPPISMKLKKSPPPKQAETQAEAPPVTDFTLARSTHHALSGHIEDQRCLLAKLMKEQGFPGGYYGGPHRLNVNLI